MIACQPKSKVYLKCDNGLPPWKGDSCTSLEPDIFFCSRLELIAMIVP